MDWQKTYFKASWPDPDQISKKFLPEVAFVGRSNVGKSSLINALCKQTKLAKTSSTPGKTQHFVFFSVADRIHLVDLPGYGYAQVSQTIRQEWEKIERYLTDRCDLILLLIDSRHGLKDYDKQFIEWARHHKKELIIVMTKPDKLNRTEIDRQSRLLKTELEAFKWFFCHPKDLFAIEQLQSQIESICFK
jgi:GTP-binding protein